MGGQEQIPVWDIFSKRVAVKVKNARLREIIYEEFNLYPASDTAKANLTIEICDTETFEGLKHEYAPQNQLIIENKVSRQLFLFEEGELTKVAFYLIKPANAIHAFIQKIRNIEFSNREDRIGQILHEQVLVPAVLFDKNKILIHSSAVHFHNKTLLFGGYGGVGKTSLEMELCYHKQADFLADDFSVISNEGVIYPNLSFPKIYGYNVQGEHAIKELLVNKNHRLDKWHWFLNYKRSPDKVRRRVSPQKLYSHIKNMPLPVHAYFLLKKYEGEKIEARMLSTKEAASLTIEILKAELNEFFKAIDSPINGAHSSTSSGIINRWDELLPRILDNITCKIILVPRSMNHEQFKSEMVELLTKQ